MVKYKIKYIKNRIDKLNVPFMSRFFSHPVSVILVFILANFTKITPNFLTWLSFIFRLVAVYSILIGRFIPAAILAYFAHLLDSSDGILARTIGKTSKFGAALDPLLDRIGYSLLFAILILKLNSFNMLHEAFLVFIMFFMYFNELNFLEICSNYKENAQFERESKLKSRISQFKRIFSIPIVGTMIKGYVVLMAKLKINSIPSLIETYFVVFIVGPFFMFNYWLLVLGIVLYVPQFLFSFLRAITTIRKLRN